MLTDTSNTTKGRLNQPNANTLPTQLQSIAFGDMVRAERTSLYHQVPVTGAGTSAPYNVSTAGVIVLPDDAKASSVANAYVRAGTTPGALTTDPAVEGAPASGHIGVTPCGNIAVLLADGATDLDLVYHPVRLDVDEAIVAVTPGTGVITLPKKWLDPVTGLSRLVMLMEAESIAGTLVSKMIVDAVGTSTATGHARLTAAKDGVSFATADAVTSGRVKVGLIPVIDMNTVLETIAITT